MSLVVPGTLLTPPLAQQLSDTLRVDTEREELVLDHVPFGVKWAPPRALTRLSLTHGNLFLAHMPPLVAYLTEMGARLTFLDLSFNLMGNNAIATLCEGLKDLPALEELRVAGNFVGNEGASALGKWAAEYAPLRRLDVSYNVIAVHGAVSLAATKAWRAQRLHLPELSINWAGNPLVYMGFSELTIDLEVIEAMMRNASMVLPDLP